MRKMLQAQAMALLAAVSISGGAVAQDINEVTVFGSEIEKTKVDRTSSGVPVMMLTKSYKVSYGDLDLKTTDGMAELTKRIEDAAKQGCREIGLAYRTAQPNDWLCARVAAKEALAEVQHLVAAN